MSGLRFCTLCEQFISPDNAERVDADRGGGQSNQIWLTPDGKAHVLLSEKSSDRKRMKDWQFPAQQNQFLRKNGIKEITSGDTQTDSNR